MFHFRDWANSAHPVENLTVREKLRFKTRYALRTPQKILIRNTDGRLFCYFFHFSKCKDLGLVSESVSTESKIWNAIFKECIYISCFVFEIKQRYLGIGTQSFWSNFNTFFRPSLSDPYWSTKHLPSTNASYLVSWRLLRCTHISTWVRENCWSDVRIFAIHTVSRRIKIYKIAHHSGKWNDFLAAAAPIYTLPPLSPDWSLNMLQWNFQSSFLASSPWKSGRCYEGFCRAQNSV